VLTATGLFQAYAKNEAAADEKYKNKVIYLTGQIASVESNLSSGYVVNVLADINSGDVITCRFPKDQSDFLVRLSMGGYVRIKGRFSGRIPVLTLQECILVDEKGAPLVK
jgi:hypothetical protein